MRFKKYLICSIEKVDGVDAVKPIDELIQNEFFNKLNIQPKMSDEDQDFAFISIKQSEGFVAGVLAQSYTPKLTTFISKEGSKEEIDINVDKANEKTLMFFNVSEKTVSIQNRRYSPPNLTPGVAVDRVEQILSEVLKKYIKLYPLEINYTMEEINDIFKSSFVTKVIYTNLKGLKIEEGAELHNPHAALDDAMRESWNDYSENINRMDIYGDNGKNLNKHPIAKIGMHLALLTNNVGNDNKPIMNKIQINDAGGSAEDIKPKGNEYQVIPISIKDQQDNDMILNRLLNWTEKHIIKKHNQRK